MISIALGSTSKYKSKAVQKVLNELDIDYRLVEVDAGSEISAQPNKPGETLQGAINRARNALKLYVQAELGLGVEFGYEPITHTYSNTKLNTEFKMICYAAICDRNGTISWEQSSSLRMPKAFIEAIDNNTQVFEEIDTLIDSVTQRQLNRSVTHLMSKRRFIYECVENVFVQFLNSEWY